MLEAAPEPVRAVEAGDVLALGSRFGCAQADPALLEVVEAMADSAHELAHELLVGHAASDVQDGPHEVGVVLAVIRRDAPQTPRAPEEARAREGRSRAREDDAQADARRFERGRAPGEAGAHHEHIA